MNLFTIIFYLFLNSSADSLSGIWLYKEDTSRIEIYQKDGKFFGKLISSKNLDCEAGTEILRDLQLVEGKWHGKYYLIKNNQWVDANLRPKKDILHFEVNYGFIVKKFHWYKEKKS